MNKFKFGIFTTLTWFVVLGLLMYSKKEGLGSVSLNEWGDFLAGFFAPVAFLWLVLGYMQQGDELQENTKALIQQKDEYSKSVQLAAYTALANYEITEMELLNSLGEKYKKGAQNARSRAESHKNKIESLLDQIENN